MTGLQTSAKFCERAGISINQRRDDLGERQRAPDPRVGFGNDGKFVDATDFEVLRANAGEQVYKVPADLDAASFDDVFIWCRKFAVPLGVAALN